MSKTQFNYFELAFRIMFDEFVYTRPFMHAGCVKTCPRTSYRIGDLFEQKREDRLT